MQLDLNTIADRLAAAAETAAADGLTVEVSATDLILVRDGYGTGRSESVPFAALFLRPDDVLAAAMQRLKVAVAA